MVMPIRTVISTWPGCKTAAEPAPFSTACMCAKEKKTEAYRCVPLSWVSPTCPPRLLLSSEIDHCPTCSLKCFWFVGGKRVWFGFLWCGGGGGGGGRPGPAVAWWWPLSKAAPCPSTTRPCTRHLSHTLCEELWVFRSHIYQIWARIGLIDKALGTSGYQKPADTREGRRMPFETHPPPKGPLRLSSLGSFGVFFPSLFDPNSHLGSCEVPANERHGWAGSRRKGATGEFRSLPLIVTLPNGVLLRESYFSPAVG